MTIYGWDMSHYDSIPAGGGAKVAAEGFSFCTHKAGGDSNDAELGAWWSAFRSFRDRLLLGAYWVLYPGNSAGRADSFLARLDDKCPGWREGPFILQLDCEIWNGDSSTKPGRADIKTACDRLRAAMPKLQPIVYASAGQYGDSLSGLGYPLWNARYPLSDAAGTASGLYVRCGGDSGKGWGSYSGQVPAIWQYSSSAVIAGQTTCDANAYRGDLADLVALVAPGWEDTMPITPDDVDTIFNTDGEIGAPPAGAPDKFWTAGQLLRNGYNEAKAAHAAASQAVAAISDLTAPAPAPIDVDALAAEVAAKAGPLIVQQVLDGIAARMQS